MKTKELIELLNKQNPEAEVRFKVWAKSEGMFMHFAIRGVREFNNAVILD